MKVTAHEFETEFTDLVQQERGINRQVVEMIAFCMKRKLYAELGYSSVQGWLIKGHGYPKTCAWRRIEAAKLVTAVPAAIERLEEGKVNLSTLATLQHAIRREEARTSEKIAPERKEKLFAMIEDKTEEQTERLVATEFPEIIKEKVESVKPVSETETRMTLIFNEKEMSVLERVKEVTGHSHFNASWSELVIAMAKEFLKHHDPVQRAERSIKRAESKLAKESTKETTEKSSAPELFAEVSPKLRAFVIYRDRASCQYIDPKTGKKCGARQNLEVDHIIPRARGGANAPDNLRALCRSHNLLVADHAFGKDLMDRKRKQKTGRDLRTSNGDGVRTTEPTPSARH